MEVSGCYKHSVLYLDLRGGIYMYVGNSFKMWAILYVNYTSTETKPL